MTSIALQTLHFESFLESLDDEISKEDIVGFLRSLDCENENGLSSSIPVEIDELFLKYEKYCELTMLGDHGPTAKYWMQYIRLIDVHRKLSRAVRTKYH